MFKTIRIKLLTILLSFVLVTIVTSVIVFNYFEKNKDSLSTITQKAENTHVLLLKDIKVTRSFFENETINPEFFRTGKSPLIAEHEHICVLMDSALSDLNATQKRNNFALDTRIENLNRDYAIYKRLTKNIFKQILVRGFKDYGIEGKMRVYAHDLENYQQQIGLVKILQLRRHEKDFIIRQEDPYIFKHSDLIDSIKTQILVNRQLGQQEKVNIITLLNNYSVEFNHLVAYEKRLGLKSRTGLKKQIDRISDKIEASLAVLVGFSAAKEQSALRNIKFVYVIIGFIFLLMGVVSALVISKHMSRSIIDLKEKIDEFVKSDFKIRTILPINNSTNEIDVLATNFSIMEQHIVDQMASLRQSNKDLEMLFYATSNDIRFPLIKVKELTDQAIVTTTDTESQEYFQQITYAWANLLSIIDELGIITNIRNVEIKTEVIDLEVLIRSVLFEFRSVPGFDNVICSLNLSVKNKFISSPGLVKAIFRNLVENAIKYATKRSGLSFLKISVSDQTGDMMKIEIADNGIGIKKEHQQKIFDMFFRGTNYARGTGLGLYIVKCSLEKLDGSITVDSVEGQGTTFKLIIPNNYKPKNIKERIIHHRELSEITQTSRSVSTV